MFLSTKVISTLNKYKLRLKDCTNYLKFGAVRVISKTQAEDLVSTGAEELPTQWIGTDKNDCPRNASRTVVEPLMKNRAVARGELSIIFNRSDSPAAEQE